MNPRTVHADRVLHYGRDMLSYKRFKDDAQKAWIDLGHPAGVDHNEVFRFHKVRSNLISHDSMQYILMLSDVI